jgi:septal ring factor EnvC (AmiA/AmiB activator)
MNIILEYIKMNFEEQIKEWVYIDNQLKILNDKIKSLREQKSKLNENIINYANKNNMFNSNIQISDGKLKFTNTKLQTPLTFKYLEKCLGDVIRNENQVKQIMDYVKAKREIKSISEIKRFSNN